MHTKRRIAHQFLFQYLIIFILSLLITGLILLVLDFANHLLAQDLVKNRFTAQSLLKDDYNDIDLTPVLDRGGGVQIVRSDYQIVRSGGLNPLPEPPLTVEKWTQFLTSSRRVGVPYSHNIAYSEVGHYWLVVSFPTSFRIDFALASNPAYASVDRPKVIGYGVAIILLYLLLLSLTTFIYARLTALAIVRPLHALIQSARKMRGGDYSARVEPDLDNELGELQATFNGMAEQIETETNRRQKAEQQRRQLVLDLSHDLKNPLASVLGYAELLVNQAALDPIHMQYVRTIQTNSQRANQLITGLFELSRLDRADYKLDLQTVDLCEWLRQWIATAIDRLDQAGFHYVFEIPENPIQIRMDRLQMNRVLDNLLDNAIRYNEPGTLIKIQLIDSDPIAWRKDRVATIQLVFADTGIGLDTNLIETIFDPFVRSDAARNSQSGGAGLGLAIVRRLVEAHGGKISLSAAPGQGCQFQMTFPTA